MINSPHKYYKLPFCLSGKIVCIVGATGFIGSYLVDAFLEAGCHVRAVSRNFPGLISELSFSNPNLSVHTIDICDKSSLLKVLKGVDVLIHLASSCLPQQSNDMPVFDVQTNLIGSLNLLECSAEKQVQKFIFISSGGTVYGPPLSVPINEDHPTNPTCSYGITKLAIEKYILLFKNLYGLNGTILRLANPYGVRQRIGLAQGVVPAFLIRAIREEPLVVWGDGTVIRDFLYITDVIEAILLACVYRGDTHTFNIGSGTGLSLNQLIGLIEDVVGRELQVMYKPSRPFDVPTNVLSIHRAVHLLKWKPAVSALEGVKEFHDYLLSL